MRKDILQHLQDTYSESLVLLAMYVHTENTLISFWAKLTLKIHILLAEYDWKVTLHIHQII